MMSVPPVDNNNVIYSNSNDIPVNDWTDDEWDDDDDDEEDEDMQVSNIRSIICSVVLRFLQWFLVFISCKFHRLIENFWHDARIS